MAIELRWLASVSASAFHAAEALVRGESLVDEHLRQELAAPVESLVDEVDRAGLPAVDMVPLLAALSSGIENNRELVEVAIMKLRGRGESTGEVTGRIAGRVADLEAAFQRTLPNAADQLALRGEPLRQQWEARGPGMLMHFGRITDPSLVAKRADVTLVYPVLGGDGTAHLPLNTVRIEALLANPHPELPETLRLGWLLSQLQTDLPIHGEQIPRARLPHVAKVATLPAILDSANYVDLIPSDPALLPLALSIWRVVSPDEASAVADIVSAWWQTYQETPNLPVRVALGSLDRMLLEAEVAAV